jgi:hypothetical protein
MCSINAKRFATVVNGAVEDSMVGAARNRSRQVRVRFWSIDASAVQVS